MDILIISAIVFFIIVIVSFGLLFSPNLFNIGVTILFLCSIIFMVYISHLLAKDFGVFLPSIFFIIVLSILLPIILHITSKTCSSITSPEKSCFEQFSPSGISTTKDGEWCYRTGDYCVASDGTTVNLANQSVNKLQKELATTQDQCQKQVEDLSKTIQSKKLKTSVSTGPCLTTDGKWGVILPQYGKKCVPMSEIEKETVKRKKVLTDKKPEKEDVSKLSPDEINKRYNAAMKKQRAGQTIKPHWKDGKYYDGETTCLPVGTDFNKICKTKYGPFYQAERPTDCVCPFQSKEDCQKYKRQEASCYCQLSDDKQYTDCKPEDADFDYQCKVKFGQNYGYKNILKNRKGCCPPRMARAECTTSTYEGIEFIEQPIKCIPTNNYYSHLEACKNTYPDKDVVAVKDIDSYNCNVGYFKSTCLTKN